MTVLEIIQRSAEFLEKKGVDSPRLQSELLLAHLLKMPRLKLYLNFEQKLTDAEIDSMRELVRRRGLREPLQHIIGSTSFCGLEMKVNRHVLIPRPETELLAERALALLSANGVAESPKDVLDFATGSGCLAIAIAHKRTQDRLWAIDLSPDALVIARENAVQHGVADRIQFAQGDAWAALPTSLSFDLIVSNPPYIPSADIASLQTEVRDFDPRMALDGGADGLDFYNRLAKEARAYLKPDGRLVFEIGAGQASSVQELFQANKWIVELVERDYCGVERILVVGIAQ